MSPRVANPLAVPLAFVRDVSYEVSDTARDARAVQPPALTSLAISMSRSHDGDDTPTGVVIS
jgi:hypothetical protein